MDNKIEVIGIDHGWSGMKTVHEVFTSGCKEISTEPAFTENLLEYGGRYYKIGSKRLEVKDTKVTDENYYMLTLAAVAKELKIRGKKTAHVLLAVGLPLTRFGDEKKDFVSYLSKKKEVSFTFEKEKYHIYIDNVCVYPQCYAAVIDRIDKYVYNGEPVEGASYYLYEDAECTDLLCKLEKTNAKGLALSGKETLTQSTYYLKEIKEAPGYQRDETVYPVGLEYFTLYDSDGKVTQQGKPMPVVEYPDTVGVMVKKTDSESGNFVKGAGFAVFTDAVCTQRVSVNGDGKEEVPVFYYDEDLDVAASAKFVKKQDKYYVKEVVILDGYRDDGKVCEMVKLFCNTYKEKF